jgi:hypothetical protein
MTWYRGLVLVGLMVLMGCAGPGPTPDGGTSAPKRIETDQAVPFFDASPFDQEVAAVMRQQAPRVTVPLLTPTTVNSIPPRLGTWLAVVKDRGGQVSIQRDPEVPLPPDVRDRGWFSDIPIIIWDLVHKIREWQLYRPAAQYNATLYYRNAGELTKVAFTRK